MVCVHVCEGAPACTGRAAAVNHLVRASLIEKVPSLREDKKDKRTLAKKAVSGGGHSRSNVTPQECACAVRRGSKGAAEEE